MDGTSDDLPINIYQMVYMFTLDATLCDFLVDGPHSIRCNHNINGAISRLMIGIMLHLMRVQVQNACFGEKS